MSGRAIAAGSARHRRLTLPLTTHGLSLDNALGSTGFASVVGVLRGLSRFGSTSADTGGASGGPTEGPKAAWFAGLDAGGLGRRVRPPPLGENRQGFAAVTGRDHHPYAFSLWMAGGGVKGGLTYGETDEIGWSFARDQVHINDFQATLLHLFGFDHSKLTHRFQGLDARVTGVGGHVIHDWVA